MNELIFFFLSFFSGWTDIDLSCDTVTFRWGEKEKKSKDEKGEND